MGTHTYQSFKGKVTKTKIVQAQDPTLVYCQLELKEGEVIPCLLARQALTFLLEVAVGDTISVYGHYNQRQQFVIQSYLSDRKAYNQSQGLRDYPDHLNYPHQTKD